MVHFGLAIMVIGITASSMYKLENQGTLRQGETLEIGEFELKYEDFRQYEKYNRTIYAARLGVFRDGQRIDEMEAERRYYINAKQPTTEVSLRSTLLEDLYVTMPGIGQGNVITLKVAVNPLLVWVWVGSFLMVIGGVIAIIPSRRKTS
jgi:cytochrome c-type biogenesis protein CcmF